MEDFYEPETEIETEELTPPFPWTWEVLHGLDWHCGNRCWWLADYSRISDQSASEVKQAVRWLAEKGYLTVVSMPAIGDHHSGFGSLDGIVLHARNNLDRPVEDHPLGAEGAARVWEGRERLRYRLEAEKLARRKRRRDAPGQGMLQMGDDIGLTPF